MAEPLKNSFGTDVPRRIGAQIAEVSRKFDNDAFQADVLSGYDELELVPRVRHIARRLRVHLPEQYPEALRILIKFIGPRSKRAESEGMASFYYGPHTFFVAEFGLDHFEISMDAPYELTQRFTAEFSIRPFLERHQDATLARLKQWATGDSEHVRRLVFEGSRAGLPRASRLRAFQKDPEPVIELLELLTDDPELYVWRSVANNLNDIGKDHRDVLVAVAIRWLKGATDARRWIVNHALRGAVKRTESGALAVLGFGMAANVSVREVSVIPERARIGRAVTIKLSIANRRASPQRALADLRVHFVKSNGKTSVKTFKLRTLELAAKQTTSLQKTISLAQHPLASTTRVRISSSSS